MPATNNQILLTLDEPTRSLNYTGQLILGVEHDQQAERIYFSFPKTIFMDEDVNLMGDDVSLYVIFKNAANSTYRQECTSTRSEDGDNVKFSWLLSNYVLKKRGNVSFSVWVQKTTMGTDSTTGEAVVIETNDWHTTPFTGVVLPGLEFEDENIEVITNDSTSIEALRLEVINAKEYFDNKTGMSDTEVADYVTGVLTPVNENIATLQSNYSTLGQTVQNQGTAISGMGNQVTANKNAIANKIGWASANQTNSETILQGAKTSDGSYGAFGTGKTFESSITNDNNKVPTSPAVINYISSNFIAHVTDSTWINKEISFLNSQAGVILDYIDTGEYIAKVKLLVEQTSSLSNLVELGDDYHVLLHGFIKSERADSRLTKHNCFGIGSILSLDLSQHMNLSDGSRMNEYIPNMRLYEIVDDEYQVTKMYSFMIEAIYKVNI